MTDHPGSDRRIEIVPSVLPADFSPAGRGGGRARGGRRRPHPVGRDGRALRAQPHLRARRDRRVPRPRRRVLFEAHLMVEDPDDLRGTLRRGRLRAAHRPRRGLPPPAPHARPRPRARRPRRRWPSTRRRPSSAVEHVLDLVDLVLVMTVNPGFGGQAYIDTMEPKVAEVRRLDPRRRPRRRHRGRRRDRPLDDPGRGGGRRQRAGGRFGAVPRPRGPRPRGHRAAGPRRGHPPLIRPHVGRARRAVAALAALALVACTDDDGSAAELCEAVADTGDLAATFQGFDPTDPEAALDQLRAARVALGDLLDVGARGGPGRPPGGDRLRAGAHRRARERAAR